ncbi:O-antigen ligase family protein [Alphaproteobacteria bacterium]|nr:O-antigen ligase family protein [Alphaproteobacteria bacterium]
MNFLRQTIATCAYDLRSLSKWDAGFVVFWFAGPLLYLIERTPADIWLSLIGIGFIAHSTRANEREWLRAGWVRFTGLFWAIALVGAAISVNPLYALGEAVAWIRFPLYAAACMFWLGANRNRLVMMLMMMAVAVVIMSGFLITEFAANFALNPNAPTRLGGPYGDLVPGGFIGKAMMPLAIVMAAIAIGRPIRQGLLMGLFAGAMVGVVIITGERMNSVLLCLSVFLASIAWVIRPARVVQFGSLAFIGLAVLFTALPNVGDRFWSSQNQETSDYFNSPYWFSVRPGIVAALDNPVTGIGVGMHRKLCEDIPHGPDWLVGENNCHPHPHQFYVQLAEETGIFGFLAGIAMIGAIIIAAAQGRQNNTLFSRLAWIPPALMFMPQPSADFFGQWNNLFLWFAVGLALAMARDKST